MVTLFFLSVASMMAVYMLLVVIFASMSARATGDLVDAGQLNMGRVRYAAFLLASNWVPPSGGLRSFKMFLRAALVVIHVSFYALLYFIAAEDGRAGELTWHDADPRSMSINFWLDYVFKVTALLSASVAAALVARNDPDGMDAGEVIEVDRWRMGMRLIFQDVELHDGLSRFLQGVARGSIIVALLTGLGAVVLRFA